MLPIYLPPEVLDLIAEETDRKSLFSFTLVCRDWEWPAKKLIWYFISVAGALHNELMKLLKDNKELGVLVKRLNLLNRIRNNRSYFELDQFTQLLARLPNLQALESIDNAVPCFDFSLNRCNGFELKFELPNITSLKYSVGLEDKELCILRELLRTAINLTTLHLQVDRDFPWDFKPIQQCSILDSFSIDMREDIEILNSSRSIIPLSSLNKLKELVCIAPSEPEDESINLKGFLELTRRNSLTLEHLDLFVEMREVSYNDFITSLSSYTSIKNLQISIQCDTRINLFQHLPSSLQNVGIPIRKSHLEHLQIHPRPDLTFNQLMLEDPELFEDQEEVVEVYQFLPKHVDVIYYGTISFRHLKWLEKYFKNHLHAFNFKKIIIECLRIEHMPRDLIRENNSKIYFVSAFKDLGIVLDFK